MAIRKRLSNFIVKKLPSYIKEEILKLYQGKNVYYSQEGEDIILSRLFEGKSNGVYIDVGAHHPTRFSNTYKFYLQGWWGINIDAMPGSMKLFNEIRSRDINLEIPVSEIEQELTYFMFNEPALNTFSPIEAKKKNGLKDYKIIDSATLYSKTLCKILDENLPVNTVIDFMSIDVEGLDLEVIRSNNWEKYRPKVLLVEDLRGDIVKVFDREIYKYITSKEYKLISRTLNTLFFKAD